MDYKTWHFLTWVMSDNWRFALPINKAKPYQRRFRTFLLAWFGMIVSSLHAVFIHFANKNKLKKSMQLSKNMIKILLPFFVRKCQFLSETPQTSYTLSLDPRPPLGPKPPEIPPQILPKKHPSFIKEEIKLWNLALWTDPSKGGL